MDIKYDNHPEEWLTILSDPDRRRTADTWFLDDRVDSWRHARMRAPLAPLFESARDKSWVTIGDGRYGTDAHDLMSRGIANVHATDISDVMLKIGADKGFINTYSEQNAEDLKFESGSFDYVYCKESYHHFPRPYVALYEMLRVCRLGVVLTEPHDGFSVLSSVNRLLRSHHIFEPVGNYVYTISRAEIEKLMLGIGLRYLAIKGINDHFVTGVEYVPLRGGSLQQRMIRYKVKGAIAVRDALCALKLAKHTIIIAVLFKSPPDEGLWRSLGRGGFRLIELPKNPYR